MDLLSGVAMAAGLGPLAKSFLLATVVCVWVFADRASGQEVDVQLAALERLATQLAAPEGSKGRLVEQTPGNLLFLPQSDPLSVSIANPQSVSQAAIGPALTLIGSLDREKRQISVQDYRIEFGFDSSLEESTDQLIISLDSITSAFADKINQALKPNAMAVDDLDPEGQGAIAKGDRQYARDMADFYERAVTEGNVQARHAAVERFANVREQLKAIYDSYDNYPPWSYDQIHRNTNAVVAIGRPNNQQAICSGVLVGKDLVLTAGHCFQSDEPSELEIWFDFVDEPGRQRERQVRKIKELVAPSSEKRDAFERKEFGRDLFDYAIVRFVDEGGAPDLIPRAALPSCRNEPAAAPPSDAEPGVAEGWQNIREEWQTRCVRRPQCLLSGRARRESPLYVVGYPKGDRETVHDNAWVYLPHQLNRNDLGMLKLSIEADYKDHPDRDAILAQFTRSYVKRDNFFFLEDERINFQPKLGIVADTFRGNSGSPVYERDQHCVVGMLISGAEDRGQRLAASWQHHESALPISVIISDLESHPDTKVLIEQRLLEIK